MVVVDIFNETSKSSAKRIDWILGSYACKSVGVAG